MKSLQTTYPTAVIRQVSIGSIIRLDNSDVALRCTTDGNIIDTIIVLTDREARFNLDSLAIPISEAEFSL